MDVRTENHSSPDSFARLWPHHVTGLHGANGEQRLYVLKSGAGLARLGFDVAERQIRTLAKWLGPSWQRLIVRQDAEPGTHTHYALHGYLMESARQWAGIRFGGICDAFLNPQLTPYLGKRVEVYDSRDEPPRRFLVGKSGGWLPIYLELHNRRSTGGVAASAHYFSVAGISDGRGDLL